MLLPLLMALLFAFTALPVFAEKSGDWEYELTQYGLTITAYHGSSKKVVIPDEIDGYKVSVIGKHAFKDNTTMKSLVIPEGISEIRVEAFYGCAALSKIEFNAVNCTVPGVWNFDENKGAGVFSGAGSASPDGIRVVFGPQVKKIPDRLFDTASKNEYGMKGAPYAYVTSVVLPDNVKEIGAFAFSTCQELKNVSFGEGIKSIGASAFWGCRSLEELTFNEALVSIGSWAFAYCENLESIAFGGNLDSIGESAFEGCKSLEKAAMVSPLTTIGRRAFKDCTAMKELVLPETLTGLQADAFLGCINLRHVEINSANLTVPGVWNFDDNKGTGVFSGAGSASPVGMEVVFGPGVTKVPDHLFETSSKDEYGMKGHPYAYVTSVIFREGVKEIGISAFDHCQSLETVTFADSITAIDAYAFRNCYALEELVFGRDLKSIGECAFLGNKGLEKIIWGDSLDSIGLGSFYGCTSLEKVHLVNPLTSLGRSAFKDCTSLKQVILPETLTKLGGKAFMDCTALSDLIIQSVNLTATEVWTFDDNKGGGIFSGAGSGSPTGLRVTFYTGVNRIPAFLFDTASIDEYGHKGYDFAYITSVVCASTVKEVGDAAFRSCQNLASIHFYNRDVTFGEAVFDNCISPAFKIQAPENGTVQTYAKEKSLKFEGSTETEVMPEIPEPEKAVKEEEVPAEEEEAEETETGTETETETGWTCPNGHSGNTSNFCPVCGAPRPEKTEEAAEEAAE